MIINIIAISKMFAATYYGNHFYLIFHLYLYNIECFFRRNQNFHDILKGLNLGQKSVFDLTNQFHHVFWFGDLNYRIALEVDVS